MGAQRRSPDSAEAKPRTRLQFDFHPENLKDLEIIRDRSSFGSDAAAVRYALRLLRTAYESETEGSPASVYLKDPDTGELIRILLL